MSPPIPKRLSKEHLHDPELVARLLAIRQHAIDQGMPLMRQDEILAEVRRRRGELPDEDNSHPS